MTLTVTTGFDKAIVKAMAGVVYLYNCIYMGKPLGSRFWQFITLYNYSIGLLHLISVPPPPCPVEDLFFLPLKNFIKFHSSLKTSIKYGSYPARIWVYLWRISWKGDFPCSPLKILLKTNASSPIPYFSGISHRNIQKSRVPFKFSRNFWWMLVVRPVMRHLVKQIWRNYCCPGILDTHAQK